MQFEDATRRQWLGRVLGLVAIPSHGIVQAATPAVHPDHPRLFFRREPWGPRGLSVGDVRSRGVSFAASLGADLPRGAQGAPELVMRYVVTGDEAAAADAIRHMKSGFGDEPWTTDEGEQIEAIAIAYDWLAGLFPGFAVRDREEIQEILIAGARRAMKNLASGASIFHTRMYAWANAVLFAGLALHGERPIAREFIDFGIRYYKERLIPARRHLGGAWFNAMSYGRKYMCRSVFSMMAAWRSATGEDLWARAKAEGGNWAENILEYLMYMLRPDHSYAGYGDFFDSMAWSHQGTMRLAAQATSETGNPYGQGFLKEIRERWKRPCYDRGSRWYQVFEDASLPSKPRSALPLSRIFGRDSIGMVVMRSGWGPGDTWILFKCGDYGDNHGHFDQGHLEIYRKGQLALDHHYWAKATRFHNTLLIRDTTNLRDTGDQREFSRQVHASLDSYLADPVVRTGDILDYREAGATTSVVGDLTPAYDPARVKSVTRQVVFVERQHLVVFDTVTVTSPRFQPRFLLHYPSEPKLEGNRFSWIDGGGQLIGRTLLPADARISAVPVREVDLDETATRIGRKYWPAGHIEVEPAGASAATFFLHLLTPCDLGDAEPVFRFVDSHGHCTLVVAGQELTFQKGSA